MQAAAEIEVEGNLARNAVFTSFNRQNAAVC
jgi:hypothetical protein